MITYKPKGGERQKMMKKRMEIGVLSVIMIWLMIGAVTGAPNIEITTSLQVIGNGTYDAEIMMHSAKCDSGLEYYGEEYTLALGIYGPGSLILSRDYMLMRPNESELMIFEESEMTNIGSKRCFKNYDLGTLQAFNTFGNYSVLAEFGGDYNMSMMMVEAEVSGKGLTEVTVKDLNNTHFWIVRDRVKYEGDYRMGLSSLIKRVEEPRAGIADWLGCP